MFRSEHINARPRINRRSGVTHAPLKGGEGQALLGEGVGYQRSGITHAPLGERAIHRMARGVLPSNL